MNQKIHVKEFCIWTGKRAFNKGFFLAIFCICLVFFLDVDIGAKNILLNKYSPNNYEGAILYIQYILLYGVNFHLFLMFVTMGYTVSIPMDWKTGIVPYIVKGVGIKKYAFIQVGAASLSGGLAAVGGFGLFYLWLRSKLPLVPKGFAEIPMYDVLREMPYYGEGTLKDIRVFLLAFFLLLFLSGAAFSALAAGVSLYLGSRYLVFVFPYLIFRGYIELAKILHIPNDLRLDRWVTAMSQPFSIPVCLGIVLAFALSVFAVSVYLFSKSIKWRLEHG